MQPIFEDSTVYVLPDSKLDDPSLPFQALMFRFFRRRVLRSKLNRRMRFISMPEIFLRRAGYFQVRNMRGQISVPATNSIVNRDTTDYTLNIGLNPTVNLGPKCHHFQRRRPDDNPARLCVASPTEPESSSHVIYMNTSSFFNAISASGCLIRESGPFTQTNERSEDLRVLSISESAISGERRLSSPAGAPMISCSHP